MAERSWRRRTIQAVAWTTGVLWLALFFGLVDLSVPIFFQTRPEFYSGYLISTGWGVLFTFFVGLPLCFAGARPDWICGALLSAGSGVAVLFACVASGQPAQLAIVFALLLPAAAIWILSQSGTGTDGRINLNGQLDQRAGPMQRIPILGLAAISFPPAIMYASEMIRLAHAGAPEPVYSWGFDHYPIQAASTLVIPLATAVLASRLPGWRPMTWLVASGTAWFGVVSIVYPNHLGSWGSAW